jgi:hypothetical protein
LECPSREADFHNALATTFLTRTPLRSAAPWMARRTSAIIAMLAYFFFFVGFFTVVALTNTCFCVIPFLLTARE